MFEFLTQRDDNLMIHEADPQPWVRVCSYHYFPSLRTQFSKSCKAKPLSTENCTTFLTMGIDEWIIGDNCIVPYMFYVLYC